MVFFGTRWTCTRCADGSILPRGRFFIRGTLETGCHTLCVLHYALPSPARLFFSPFPICRRSSLHSRTLDHWCVLVTIAAGGFNLHPSHRLPRDQFGDVACAASASRTARWPVFLPPRALVSWRWDVLPSPAFQRLPTRFGAGRFGVGTLTVGRGVQTSFPNIPFADCLRCGWLFSYLWFATRHSLFSYRYIPAALPASTCLVLPKPFSGSQTRRRRYTVRGRLYVRNWLDALTRGTAAAYAFRACMA